MENNEREDEEEDFNIGRRNTIHKLNDFVKFQKDLINQEIEKSKKKVPTDSNKTKELNEKIRKSIVIQNLGEDKKIKEKLANFINSFVDKHKINNYEKIPDYLDKKEDSSQLIKSCNKQKSEHTIDFPLIIVENNFYDSFSIFLEDSLKYEEYKVIYILKDKLIIKMDKINNYDIFHKTIKNEEMNNIFIAETISTSMVDLYNDDQLKDIEKSLGIISNKFKTNMIKEMEKWVATVYNIISEFILFKLKDNPLYYCCDVCKKPIIFKEQSIYNIINNYEIENNNDKTDNINNNSNDIMNNNKINVNNNINDNNNKKELIQKIIKKKKEKDKQVINKIINDKNKKIEYKNLFNVANNIISLIDFSKFNMQNSMHYIANPPPKSNDENNNDTPTGPETYNNVLYYTENKYADYELFEKEVSGAFIFVTEQKSLEYVMQYLKNENENELNKFILLISGQCCEKTLKLLNEKNYLNDFMSCILFTKNDKYNILMNNYSKIKGIFKTKKDIIKYFNNNSNQQTPYFTFKLINLKKYCDYYYKFHKRISSFYGQLSQNLFERNIALVKKYLESLKQDNQEQLLEALNVFQNGTKGKIGIIKGYTGNSFYEDFNKWLYRLDPSAIDQTGYFLSGLSYSLNLYGEEANKNVNEEITLYRGLSLTYINILPYKNNIGNIITFPSFLSTTTNFSIAENFSYLNLKENQFRVIMTIKYKRKNNWLPNAVNVDDISLCQGEEERLFHTYSFFKIKNVKIDIENKYAGIELDTVGKTCIFEEEYNKKKKIRYNYKEDALESY